MRSILAATALGLSVGIVFTVHPAVAQPVAAIDACTPAAGEANGVICGSPALAAQDRQLRVTYRYLMDFGPFWATQIIARDQEEWLGTRAACGSSQPCLSAAYRGRLIGLFGWMECLRTELPLEG